MTHPSRSLAVVLAALSLSACVVGDDDVESYDSAEQSLWVGGKDVKVNPAVTHWRRDLEAQVAAHQTPVFENPSISSISPSTAQRGQVITIAGARFNRMLWGNQTYTISFQAGATRVAAAPISTTDTQIRVAIPQTATTGLVRLVGPTGSIWAEGALPLTINIPAPATGTARFTNNSQFEVHVLTVNGQHMIPQGQVLAPGAAFDVDGPGSIVPFHAELGFNLFTFFILDGSVTIVNGQIVAQSIQRVTASMVLTMGAPSAVWEGSYFDSNTAPHTATIVFRPNGTYDLRADNVLVGSGVYADRAFAPGQSAIAFSVGGVATSIDFPYGSFTLRNGPPSWPNIQYVRR